VLPIVVPLVALGAAGYLARNRNTTRSTENASGSAHEPSPFTVLGAFLSTGETPPLVVVVGAVEHAESLGYTGLAHELAQLFLLPPEQGAYDSDEADVRDRGVTPRSMAAPAPTRTSRNSAAAVAAAVASTRSSSSSAVGAPLATWSRAYPAGWTPPMAADTSASTSSLARAVPPMSGAPASSDPVSAEAAASSLATAATPAIAGTAAAPAASNGIGAGAVDVEAQRVLEMLTDPASRAAKVEFLSGAAAGSAATVEALPRVAPMPEIDAEAQRVLDELARLGGHAAKVEFLPATGAVDADLHRVLEVSAAGDTQGAQVELLPGAGVARDPEVMLASSSPIAGVAPAAWLRFVGQVSREAPTFSGTQHVGRFRQRRDRLLELGIDPAKVIDSPDAQLAALDADMLDAYKHAQSSGLVDEYLGTKVELRAGAEARPTKVTLSGVLGVIQAAGLEGAVQWLEQPADRTRFPNTTQAFLRCNGVF